MDQEELKKEIYATSHKEETEWVETVVDIRAFTKDLVFVLDKLTGKWTMLSRELIFEKKKE